ncbi:MAG TPA: type III-B CRISPR module RAMP protein Cmr6 [Proteobacteria bacterium]|nr:type III-B CRISPR module RAMP protein Cmr6 [Pseudomonadota bacterium]
MTTNASFIYYRDKSFGKKLNEKEIGEILGLEANRLDSSAKICGITYFEHFKIPDTRHFSLSTTYPGLIIGAGYNHPAGKIEEDNSSDFQLGFYFDHTTGMPVIPGSTVKGILKSVFPKDGDKAEIKKEKMKYINTEVIKDILKINGLELVDNKGDKNDWRRLFEKGNIFYDSYISATDDGRVFAEDYITPHKNIFKNPIPIRFLKIAPDVTFTFQFKLKDSCFKNSQKISSNEKLKLFKKILLDFGIGAKRNVGYGNLIE